MTLYTLRVILAEDMEWTGKYGNTLEGEVTEFDNLRKVARPYRNGTGRLREAIHITHEDGTKEVVDGHLVSCDETDDSDSPHTTPSNNSINEC